VITSCRSRTGSRAREARSFFVIILVWTYEVTMSLSWMPEQHEAGGQEEEMVVAESGTAYFIIIVYCVVWC